MLTADFAKCLESEGKDVNVRMLVTPIHKMSKGKEREFLVVHLGVSHLRVLHISKLTFIDNIFVFSVIYNYMTLHDKSMYA